MSQRTSRRAPRRIYLGIGAQLTNVVFVRPCTVVYELFPRRFYYPKKGPLAMEAGGIAFDGYTRLIDRLDEDRCSLLAFTRSRMIHGAP